ncbi:MAG: hypothetical protein ACLQAT_08030 [Candidatus Binataceae bacterium]
MPPARGVSIVLAGHRVEVETGIMFGHAPHPIAPARHPALQPHLAQRPITQARRRPPPSREIFLHDGAIDSPTVICSRDGQAKAAAAQVRATMYGWEIA